MRVKALRVKVNHHGIVLCDMRTYTPLFANLLLLSNKTTLPLWADVGNTNSTSKCLNRSIPQTMKRRSDGYQEKQTPGWWGTVINIRLQN